MIEINNLTPGKIGQSFLKKVAKIVLKGENKETMELSIVLACQRRMQSLNKKYRQKNKPTDVLSFLLEPDKIGEIVICPAIVGNNAKEYKEGFKKELAGVLVHGILHLTGYDHEKSKKEAETMEKKQKHYLLKVLS